MVERFTAAGKAAWALLGVGALCAVVGWILWQFRVVFPHIVFAGAIVFILNPVVTALEHRRIPRAAGTAISYLGVAGIAILLGFLVAPLISRQSEDLADQWPELRADVEDWVDDLSERSKDDSWFIEIPNVDELRDQIDGTSSSEADEFDRVVAEAAKTLEDDEPRLAADLDRVAADAAANFDNGGGFTEQLDVVREVGTRVFEIGLIFILGPIIAFYLLVDLPHISDVVRQLVPERAQPQTFFVAHRLNHAIGGFFRGQLLVAVIVGIMVSIGLAIIDLPFWLIVGMIAGFFNMIPLIGPWVGAIPGIAIALTTRDFSTAVWVAVIMTVAQQIDNHFVSPMVMQRTTSLHPAVVMLALLAGGSLGGFFGLLLAVPTTAAVKVVLSHLWHVYILDEPFGPPADDGAPAAGGSPPPAEA